jgi:hypothetical protein
MQLTTRRKVADRDNIDKYLSDAYLDNVIETAIAKFGDAVDSDIAALNKDYALVIVGNGVAVIKTSGQNGVEALTVGAFKTWLANRTHNFTDSDGNEHHVPLANFWLHHKQRRQYQGITFAPKRDVPGYYNLWQGFAVEPKPGDCTKFLAHVRDNICCGDPALYVWVIAWLADIFQNPGKKKGTSLALRGGQGAGKGIVGKIIGSLLGNHYAHAAEGRYITGRFNSHMIGCLLLHADEAVWGGDRQAEGKLKDLVTEDKHYIEFKGKEPVPVDNFARLLISGNHDWVVPAGFDERRFAVLDVGEAHKQDFAYFAAIEAEADNGGREALLHHLLNVDLSKVNLRKIPMTAALLDQKFASLNPEQSWWLDTLSRGELPWGCIDVNGKCPRQRLFDAYIRHAAKQGARRRSIETTLGIFLRKYVPGLTGREGFYKHHWDASGSTLKEAYGYLYQFPTLKECRAAFAERLHQEVTWSEKTDWTTEPMPDPPQPQ